MAEWELADQVADLLLMSVDPRTAVSPTFWRTHREPVEGVLRRVRRAAGLDGFAAGLARVPTDWNLHRQAAAAVTAALQRDPSLRAELDAGLREFDRCARMLPERGAGFLDDPPAGADRPPVTAEPRAPFPRDPGEPHDVTVVVDARVREEARLHNLRCVVAALHRQSLPADRHRIVLVEQDTRPRLRAEFRPLVDSYLYVANPGRYNRSWAHNVAALHGPPRGTYLLFMDADFLPPDDFLGTVLAAAGPSAAGVLPYRDLLYLDGPSSARAVGQHFGAGPRRADPDTLFGYRVRDVPGAAALLVRRDVFLDLGGYDERLEGWGLEDHEFAGRLLRRHPVVRLEHTALHLDHPIAASAADADRNAAVLAGDDVPAGPIGDPRRYAGAAAATADFRDPELPDDRRAALLLARLTLDEKVAMLHSHAAGVPRLGVAPFRVGGEVLHGLVASTPTTVFPQAVGLGATWNPDLLRRVGQAAGDELDHLLHRTPDDPLLGRNLWSPVVNLLRDPRWGRNEEGYGEDPHHTTVLARNFCRGLVDADPDGRAPRRLRAAPTLKHYLAYNHERDKFTASASVPSRVRHEYEMPCYAALLGEGVALAVMPTYHLVNGRPGHLSQYLRELRAGAPDVVVVSDGFAPSDLIEKSRYYDDREHAYAAAIRAGLDNFTDHWDDPVPTLRALHNALDQGLLAEDDIDRPVRRLLLLRFRLGEFDPPAPPPPPPSAAAHRELAREAVRDSIVLLTNDGVLPFAAGPGERTAVIGPLGDQVCRDWYSGTAGYAVTPAQGLRAALGDAAVTFTEGVDRVVIRRRSDGLLLTCDPDSGDLAFAAGPADAALFDRFDWGEGGVFCLRSAANGRFVTAAPGERPACQPDVPGGWDVRETFRLIPAGDGGLLRNEATGRFVAAAGDDATLTAREASDAVPVAVEVVTRGSELAARAAREAGRVVLVVGTYPQINGSEMHDRTDLSLAPQQLQMADAVLAAHPRTAVVLVSGHPLAVPELAERAPALLWTSHGGPELGHGLADVLLGAHSPTGRLPQTWPSTHDDLGDLHDYDLIGSRLTYLYADRKPLFPFGHGLSYGEFHYRDLKLDRYVAGPGDRVVATVTVVNAGPVAATDVVQWYVRALEAPVPTPLRRLHGFTRVTVPAGGSRTVTCTLDVGELTYWDVDRHRFTVIPGLHQVTAGHSATAAGQTATFAVAAPAPPARDVTGRVVRAADFDDHHAVRIADELRLAGESVAGEPGSWLRFRDADLTAGPVRVAVRVRTGDAVGGPGIEVRTGHPHTGPLLGVVPFAAEPAATGAWRTITAGLAPAAGRHDVYLVFRQAARLASFVFTPAPPDEE